MKTFPQRPITYLITRGQATNDNFEEERSQILATVRSATECGISFVQIREKQIATKLLYSLTVDACAITRETSTKLLVNDRADVASAAGADGVHLTSRSLPVKTVRRAFGNEMIIAVSTHQSEEVTAAAAEGADMIVFGPVFPTPGKGEPTGCKRLSEICKMVEPFPVIALGGVNGGNFRSVLDAGAAGFASIRFLNDPETLGPISRELKLYGHC